MLTSALGVATAVGVVATAIVVGAPSAHATTTVAGFEIAAHGVNGNVGFIGTDGVGVDLHWAITAGASPAITALSGGGAAIEFQQANGFPAHYRDDTGKIVTTSDKTVLSGSRLAMASDNAGSTQTVFLDTSRYLERHNGDTFANSTGIQVATGTSPSIAFTSDNVAHIAFAGTDGLLYELTGLSTLTKIAGGISAKAGTSPAIAAQGSTRVVAFIGTDNFLYEYNESTNALTHVTKEAQPGTNPAITADGRGGFVATYFESDGAVAVVNADGGLTFPLAHTFAAGTSPAIASDGAGGWRVAFTDSNNHVAIFEPDRTELETAAVVAAGTSPTIAYVKPIPSPSPNPNPSPTQTGTLTLVEQTGNVGFVPYAGTFPGFGTVPPSHLLSIQFPSSGLSRDTLLFLKPGHSNQDCDDPNAVVPLSQGATTTPDQLAAIFGTAQPHFTTLQPLSALACYLSATNGPFPSFVDLQITYQLD